jgi:hypothetical protein
VFSAGSIGNRENGLLDIGRRASDSPVKNGGLGNGSARRMTLGGSAARVTNPGWGSMGPPPVAAAVTAVKTAEIATMNNNNKGSIGKRGWR